MMLAISEYVHDYSGCGDKDLSLGRSLSPPLCRGSPAESLADSDQWVGKDTCSLRVPSSIFWFRKIKNDIIN